MELDVVWQAVKDLLIVLNLLAQYLGRYKLRFDKVVHNVLGKSKPTLKIQVCEESTVDVRRKVVVDETCRQAHLIFKENSSLNVKRPIIHKTPPRHHFIDQKGPLNDVRLTIDRGICSINGKIKKYQYLYSGKGVELNLELECNLNVSKRSVISKLRRNLFAFEETENVDFHPPVIIGEVTTNEQCSGNVQVSDEEDTDNSFSWEDTNLQRDYYYDPINGRQNVDSMLEIFFVGKQVLSRKSWKLRKKTLSV